MTTTATGGAQGAAATSGQGPQDVAAGTTATPQGGESQDGTTPEGTQAGATPTPGTSEHERKLAERERENADLRRRLKKRDDEDAAKAAAAMTEAEQAAAALKKLQAERDEWQAEKRKLLADAEARDLGAKLGLIDYRDALALIPPDQIVIDETSGKPTNLEQLFRDLVKEKGYLVEKATKPAPPSTGAAAGTSGGPAPRLTADELDAANKAGIAPERWAALKGVSTLADWQKTRAAKNN